MDALLNFIKALADIQRVRIIMTLRKGTVPLQSPEIRELSPSTAQACIGFKTGRPGSIP
jgi:hypothetical protein